MTSHHQPFSVSTWVRICSLLLLTATFQLPAASPWQIIAPYAAPPADFTPDPAPWRDPLLFPDNSQATTPAQWDTRRQQIIDQWHSLMGEWPPLIIDPSFEILETTQQADHQRQRIRFQWTPQLHTEAWLLIPHHLLEASHSAAAVLTVYYEPDTAAGLSDKPDRDFALQLTRKGFITLSVGTTESSEDKTYAIHHPSRENTSVQPLSMLAYAAANCWHLLASLPQVDAKRIGVTGHSYGGKWSMFASCLFERFACAAWSDPGIVFDDTRPSINYWEPWYLGSHPPPWRKRGLITADNPAHGLYPQLRQQGLDLHELHVLMAPRPFLVSGGSEDPPERWHPLQHSIRVNQLLGQQDRVFMHNRPEHAPNPQSNLILTSFFEHFLQPTPAPKAKQIRFLKGSDQDQLQTVIQSMSHPDGSRVDLIGAVHIADAAYFDTLNTRFQSYDAVLYELVGNPQPGDPLGRKNANPNANANLAWIGQLQEKLRSLLQLEAQLEKIDYTPGHFVHADMDTATFLATQKQDRESFFSLWLKALKAQSKPSNPALNSDLGSLILLARILSSNNSANELKRFIGEQFDQVEDLITGIEAQGGTVIVGKRNDIALQVLQQQIAAGKTHLALFYGAAHLPDLISKLQALGFTPGTQEWLTAWQIPKNP